MVTNLINHLRIPGEVPNEFGLQYLEQVEATATPYGGRWLAQGAPDAIEGTWPGSVVLMEFPNRAAADAWYNSPPYQAILPLRTDNSVADLILIDDVGAGYSVSGFAREVRAALASTVAGSSESHGEA